jgi:hypothetical protein
VQSDDEPLDSLNIWWGIWELGMLGLGMLGLGMLGLGTLDLGKRGLGMLACKQACTPWLHPRI